MMKKIILTAVSSIALMNATHAASPFSGFYLGGGLALNRAKTEGNSNDKGKMTKSRTTPTFLTYMGSGQTFSGGFYFGGELTLGYERGTTFASKDGTNEYFVAPSSYSTRVKSKGGFFGEIAARLGYVIYNKTLVYGKGGYAWQPKAEFSGEGTSNGGQASEFRKLSFSRNGWILGLGVEHALCANPVSPNWLIRAEYKYNFGGTANKGLTSVTGGVERPEGNLKLRTKAHVYTLGLAYKF